MSAPNQKAPVVEYATVQVVTDKEINALIRRIWSEMQADPDLHRTAAATGVDPKVLASTAPPFKAEGDGSQFDMGATIFVFIVAEVSKDLIGHAITVLWDKYFAPRIDSELGGKLERK